MRTVSVYRLRDNLAGYLDTVQAEGSSLLVSRFGKPLAVIAPYKKENLPHFKEYFGFLGRGKNGEAFLKEVRRSAKEKAYVLSLRAKR